MARTILWLVFFCGAMEMSALDWRSEKGYRYAELTKPPAGKPGFEVLAANVTGIYFSNILSKGSVATNRSYENGSGVALGDIDGDG
ncbi:MAG TPA: hypothetical protein VGP94_04880, partial [Tepidisphaeraceae bacterium]|nr:hypothetical protein [Tepidisphaeraceae bacterium]